MKRKFMKKILTAVIAAAMVLTVSAPVILADNTVIAEAAQTLPVKCTYDISGAQSIVAMINSLRTGADAWYWNTNNSEKVNCGPLSELQWDEGLAQDAMQRAAEIAVSFSHTRPDGQNWSTVDTTSMSCRGENIAAGQTSPASANESWREDNEYYGGQGHRRNMLDGRFNYVGIAHVEVNGTDYWVEEFGSSPSQSSYGITDGAQPVYVTGNFSSIDISIENSITGMKAGETRKLPTARCLVQGDNYWGSEGTEIDTPVTATISNTDVAELNGSTITAKKAGTFDVVYSSPYATKTMSVTVGGSSDTSNNNNNGNENSGSEYSYLPDGITNVHNFDSFEIDGYRKNLYIDRFLWIQIKTGDDLKIQFSSSDSNVAEITDQGYGLEQSGYNIAYVKGVGAGTAIIHCVVPGKGTLCDLTVNVSVDESRKATVTFDSDGGSYVAPVTYIDGIAKNLPTPTREGYTFVKWVSKKGSAVYNGMSLNGDDTFVAVWEKIKPKNETDENTGDSESTGNTENNENSENTGTSENNYNDDNDEIATQTVQKPSKVSGLKLKRSGKNKVKISWRRKSGLIYKLSVKSGKKKYTKTTSNSSTVIKAKKGQKVTVRITAIAYDEYGHALKSKTVKKTMKI